MERDQEIKKQLTQVLLVTKVKDLGVDSIYIEFSGSGDSGDVDDVNFHRKGEDISSVIEQSINEESAYDEKFERTIDLFKDIAWQIINEKVDAVGDWVNNEGGFGHLEIDVYKKTYDLTYSQRTTEEYDWSDEFLFI
jgi:hypothetical protein